VSPAARRWCWAALAVVAAVLAAFQPALGADFQESWDDNYNLLEHDRWRGLDAARLAWMATTFHMGHWHPATWLSFALDHAVWGMHPAGYHLTNVLLHAAAAVLFLFLCNALLRASRPDAPPATESVLPPLAGALFFAVHPLRVESVAWITERRDVLSGLLLIATVLAWLRWRAGGARRWYALALGAYALSLTAKAWGITLPAVLLVLDAYPLRRRWSAALLVEKLPFVALAVPAALLAIAAQHASGATDYAAGFTLAQKAAQACYGLAYYVVKTAAPVGLLPVYTLDTALDPGTARFVASFAGVALAAGAAVALRRRAPWIAAALAVYAVVVAPVLGLTQSGIQIVADRYSYLATLPFAVLVAALAARLPRKVAAPAGALVLAALGAATHGYVRAWHDSRTLFAYGAERAPHEWWFWNELGTLAFRDGDVALALERYDRALACDARAWAAYENRGIARMRQGDAEGAVADWTRAIEGNPSALVASVNRGNERMKAGDLAGAREDYERAVRAAPDGPEGAGPWLMLGTARMRLGETAGARAALERARALAPEGSHLRAQAVRRLAELEDAR
jgi:tetratricopeptide (TPR) repeat protein